MHDLQMTDQVASHENAQPEIARHEMQARTLSVLLKMQDLKFLLWFAANVLITVLNTT